MMKKTRFPIMLSKEQHDELCVSYASLALFDGEAEISADQIKTIIEASGNEVEPYWPIIFGAMMKKQDVKELILSGGAGAGGGGDAPAAGGEAAAEVVEEAKKEEEESAEEMGGMDMFGGGGDDY